MDDEMDDGMDGWMDEKLPKKRPRRPLLYVIILTSIVVAFISNLGAKQQAKNAPS
jgi:hypothetical protein